MMARRDLSVFQVNVSQNQGPVLASQSVFNSYLWWLARTHFELCARWQPFSHCGFPSAKHLMYGSPPIPSSRAGPMTESKVNGL